MENGKSKNTLYQSKSSVRDVEKDKYAKELLGKINYVEINVAVGLTVKHLKLIYITLIFI